MGNFPSSPIERCLSNVCAGRDCVGFPSNPLYDVSWVKRYNLDSDVSVAPVAVIRVDNAQDVAAAVRCATQSNLKVQARSGGHSYGNYGLGGPGANNVVTIDMANLQKFSMDTNTWRATLGAGHQLGAIDQLLHNSGGRGMSHGVCPTVGMGGHATVGGLGASSRAWGSTLDHVLEVEVVVADGRIVRASDTQNSDLFFAIKGAGASFGIVTEFVVRTQPEPQAVAQIHYSLTWGDPKGMAATFKQWQDAVSDPWLDRRFGSQVIISELGILIESTFYGTADELQATGILSRLPQTRFGGPSTILTSDWLSSLAHQAEMEALYLTGINIPFYSKSLGFRRQDLFTQAGLESVMSYIKGADKGTLVWAVIFDLEGGAVNDVPLNATAYPHRDKVMFYQSYAVGIPGVSAQTKNFLGGLDATIRGTAPAGTPWTSYAGYVDPKLGSDAQPFYWGSNYPTLQQIKRRWDPSDVFRNPQSVRPA